MSDMGKTFIYAMQILGCDANRGKCRQDCCDGQNCLIWMSQKFSLLEKYEDTGKTPDEIQQALADLARYRTAEQEGRLVELPCKVGDTVYLISYCENVMMNYDDNYETGTGAMECPFENDCPFEDCDDGNKRVFETTCSGFFFDEDRKDVFFDHINAEFCVSDFGKTVFLTRAEAEAALAKKGE